VDSINEYCEGQFCHFHRAESVVLLSVDAFIDSNQHQNVRSRQTDQRNQMPFADRMLHDEAQHLAVDLSLRDEDVDFPIFEPQEVQDAVKLTSDSYNIENINGMQFKGVPPHRLKLYRGAIVVLLRNIDAANRLQNGVRLIVHDFIMGNRGRPRLIVVTRAEDEIRWRPGESPPRRFLLHRIKFMCTMGAGQDAVISRQQFPVRPCHGISIHKSQSMTLRKSALDVRTDCFEHGQHFVGLSRGRYARETALLIRKDQVDVLNIVLEDFLER